MENLAMIQIFTKLMKLKNQNTCYVFFDYHGHVDCFDVQLLSLKTDFKNRLDEDVIFHENYYLEYITQEQYEKLNMLIDSLTRS